MAPAPPQSASANYALVEQIKEMALAEFKRALDAASPEDILRGVMEALGRKPLGLATPADLSPATAAKPSASFAPAPAPVAVVETAPPSARERL